MSSDELTYYLFSNNNRVNGQELLEKMSEKYYYTTSNFDGEHKVVFEFCKETWKGSNKDFNLAVLEATAKVLNFKLPEEILCQLNQN